METCTSFLECLQGYSQVMSAEMNFSFLFALFTILCTLFNSFVRILMLTAVVHASLFDIIFFSSYLFGWSPRNSICTLRYAKPRLDKKSAEGKVRRSDARLWTVVAVGFVVDCHPFPLYKFSFSFSVSECLCLSLSLYQSHTSACFALNCK